MTMVRAAGIAIIAFLCLIAFSFAYAEEITIYGSEGTQVIQVPDSTETHASEKPYIENSQQPKTETWHLVPNYQGQQENPNKQEEERIETKNRQMKEERQNKRGGGTQRPLNQYRLN
jgi:hypothetical protein